MTARKLKKKRAKDVLDDYDLAMWKERERLELLRPAKMIYVV
jgi:hypothetical protein